MCFSVYLPALLLVAVSAIAFAQGPREVECTLPPEYPLLRILPSQGGKDAVGYRFAKMKIDADGAPNAYHPDNIQAALDHLANAGAAIESPGAQRLIADTREKTKTWMDLFRQARANDFVGYPKFDW